MSETRPLAIALMKAVAGKETETEKEEPSKLVGPDEGHRSLGTSAAARDMMSAVRRDDADSFMKALNHFLDIRG